MASEQTWQDRLTINILRLWHEYGQRLSVSFWKKVGSFCSHLFSTVMLETSCQLTQTMPLKNMCMLVFQSRNFLRTILAAQLNNQRQSAKVRMETLLLIRKRFYMSFCDNLLHPVVVIRVDVLSLDRHEPTFLSCKDTKMNKVLFSLTCALDLNWRWRKF